MFEGPSNEVVYITSILLYVTHMGTFPCKEPLGNLASGWTATLGWLTSKEGDNGKD